MRGSFDQANREVVDWEAEGDRDHQHHQSRDECAFKSGPCGGDSGRSCRVNQGTSEVGKILAFMTYFTIILNALMSISRLFIMISKAAASARRIVTVLEDGSGSWFSRKSAGRLETGTEKKAATGGREADAVHVEFDHVSFSYNKVENNLEDISFRLKRGETLGIIGATGAGKTTIVNLLMRFTMPIRERSALMEKMCAPWGLHDLRKRFGTVFQNDTIFEDTIMENINMGRSSVRKRLWKRFFTAGPASLWRRKRRYFSAAGYKGANLSGGQKQRILIARALAAKPDILILDDSLQCAGL